MENARCGEIAVLLDQLDELIDEGKPSFLSGKLAVDKDQIVDIIRDIRLKLPTELQQSLWIVQERNKILAEAQKEAHLIIEEAQDKLESLIDRNEVTAYARERAENIIESARVDARQIHMGAVDYADDVFEDTERRLKMMVDAIHQEVQDFENEAMNTLRRIYDNRRELKNMANQISASNE